MVYTPGSLVNVRNRDWVVLPSDDQDLVLLKPLDGSEDEITGIYQPLRFKEDDIKSSTFPVPTEKDIGDLSTARLLYNAVRLSFRNSAGPFRSLARLSFRPRSYQMVPLIMALRINPVRLLIADDVGIGKTIEAILILRELLERREIKRFAVICLPHLCEQWQAELKDKCGIEAVVIRSNTQARLDREIHGDTSVYEYYPYQVISIDFIKSEHRRQVFIQQCPEFIVVDEAHTCARPAGADKGRQQRHKLIHDLSQIKDKHLVLLTASPHSGKPAEFQSLLGLLHSEFEPLDLPTADEPERKKLARHFVQRRRANVEKWMGEETPFPTRESGEFNYALSPQYKSFFTEMLQFARGLMFDSETQGSRKRFRYWSALALLRGVMSSPAAGYEMLKNRISKISDDIDFDEEISNPILDDDFGSDGDFIPTHILNQTDWSETQSKKLKELAKQIEDLKGYEYDLKADHAFHVIYAWLKEGFHPIIFCRYIATAKYLGGLLSPRLKEFFAGIDVQVVTSEDHDDVRRQRIEAMAGTKKRVLIATDCLSEGINLQDSFTSVLHYDLPWNPNKLEQREGRVDRFGQSAEMIKAYLLFSSENPIDGVVLRVLLRKVQEIRRSIGISIPFPEDSKSMMDAVLQSLLLRKQTEGDIDQVFMDFGETDPIRQNEIKATKAYEEAIAREKQFRNIFAQRAIKAHEIEDDLKQADRAIGDPKAVESFVTESCRHLLGVQIDSFKKGHKLYTTNLPPVLKGTLPEEECIQICFHSPTPSGYLYIGRNHPFVEYLCQFLLACSINQDHQHGPSRASVISCREVQEKTTLITFRVRNVIENKSQSQQLVAEEMLMWGYIGNLEDKHFLTHDEAQSLLQSAKSISNLTPEASASFLEHELESLIDLSETFDAIALERSEILVEMHERFRKAMGGSQYKVVKPVLPMDIIGIYILLPETRQ